MKIDLNCDMGESFGTYKIGADEEVIKYITSANVACGFHASDPMNMHKTVKLAKKYNVKIGAHPSFPDLVGFGRRVMNLSPNEIKADVIYQIGALKAFCDYEGVPLHHVKPHGALYNTAAANFDISMAIAEAVMSIDDKLAMFCLYNSELTKAAKKIGVKYIEEAFADRAYDSEGRLVSRKLDGSVIEDEDLIVKRVLDMVKFKKVIAITGESVDIDAGTICVHGDNRRALDIVVRIREALEKESLI